MQPYPARTGPIVPLVELREKFDRYQADKESVRVAGRILSIRQHGGLVFADLFDGTARIQIALRKEELPEHFDTFLSYADQGDFIVGTGTAFLTKRGEQSVNITDWRMLSKSLRPIPSEWYGLKDEELRYRLRYLDMLLDKDVRGMAERKSKFWNTVRSFLLERGFVEVETPVLETSPGGADARPFETHHNALDLDVYLRISTGELWQKRLLVGGFPKVFEIGRIFRNEGMSSEHLQDYTQLEFYQAYADYQDGMKLVQEMYRRVARDVYGRLSFTAREQEIDLGKEWETVKYSQALRDAFGIDVLSCTDDEAVAAAERAHIQLGTGERNKARAVDHLWKSIRRSFTGPAFLIGVPAYLEPLAKRSYEDPRIVERFQILLAGSEVGKGYSELNDPRDQYARFAEQQALREKGDDEAQRLDMSYIEALEYGMPPALGFGVSERLFSFFEGKSVRETQLFPLLKPKQDEE